MCPRSSESGPLMSTVISHENSKHTPQSQSHPPTPCHTPPPPLAHSLPSTSLPLHNIHNSAQAEEQTPCTSSSKSNEPTLPPLPRAEKLHILICANGGKDTSQAETLAIRLSKNNNIECRAVVDSPSVRIKQYIPVIANRRGYYPDLPDLDNREGKEEGDTQAQSYGGMADGEGEGADLIIAREWASWADILILAPIDADTLGRMVHGLTGSTIASILRGWDVGKRIIMIPGMSRAMWEHPVTRRQMGKIGKKWGWVRVCEPMIWGYEDGDAVGPRKKVFLGWNGLHDVVGLVENMVEVRGIGEGEESSAQQAQVQIQDGTLGEERKRRFNKRLPPEIWSLVFTHMADWETAQNLGIYTTLPAPKDWERCLEMVAKDFPPPPPTMPPESKAQYNMHLESLRLQYAILTQPIPVIISMLDSNPDVPLTPLSVKLVVKFNYLSVLRHIAQSPELSRQYDGITDPVLPHKASYNYCRPQILEWWKEHLRLPGHPEPPRHYGPEAIDGASKQGFVEVLEWWRRSGLCMKYTEAALEQASARGLIHVLEWWKAASLHTSGQGYLIDEGRAGIRRTNTGTTSPVPSDGTLTPSHASANSHHALRLKVGKSLLTAAQHGHASTIRWWVHSGIPFSHEEGVAKIASAYGHVDVLETWKQLKGDKFSMCYDSQVLVGATKNGFVRVLEWWRRQTLGNETEEGGKRLKVEYKTCDIEEALEDSVEMEGCEGEKEVRRWWRDNGLNLGVATGEWMELKSL